MPTDPTSTVNSLTDWFPLMTPEVIATLIASFGAIMASIYGIHRASRDLNSPVARPAPATPSSAGDVAQMMVQYLERLSDIENGVGKAVHVLQEIRRALDGTGLRQEKMVDELETLTRTMTRIENAQGAVGQMTATMRHYEEAQVQVLAQIREEIKLLRSEQPRQPRSGERRHNPS